MNFTIPNTGILFSMFQNAVHKDLAAGLAQSQNSETLFADQLDRMMGSVSVEKEAVNNIIAAWTEQRGAQHLDQISTVLEENKGQRFISGLKAILLTLSNGSLEDLKIDPSGLETIEKILLSAGFSSADVDDLIFELSEMADEKPLDLRQVFEKIEELQVENPVSFDESTLTHDEGLFLESVLTTLGFSHTQIQETFDPAQRSAETLSLDRVISQLQYIQKSSFYSHQPFQIPKTNNNLKTAVAGLGISFDQQEDGWVTLDDVVNALERIRSANRIAQPVVTKATAVDTPVVSSEKSSDLLSELFKVLELETRNNKNDSLGIETAGKKEPFNGSTLIDKDIETEKKSLFEVQNRQQGLQDKANATIKEIERSTPLKYSSLPESKESAEALKNFKRVFRSVEKRTEPMMSEARIESPSLKSQTQAVQTKPKALPAYVTQQVGKSVIRAVSQGENRLVIQLKPPELGRILVKIESTNQTMQVNIMTENHAAREIITQNITELRTLVSGSGVTLERFEVDMSSDFRQSMADARHQAGQSGGHGKQSNAQKAANVEGVGKTDSETMSPDLNPDGSVHLVA